MNDSSRLVLLLALFSVLLACLPSLGQCFMLYETDADEETDGDSEWKRGYAGKVVAEPVARSPMNYKSMSKYLQNLASRRLVSDHEFGKRQVNFGLRLAAVDALRNQMDSLAALRNRQAVRNNLDFMTRVGRRR
ncbi:uncharacterized protein [Diadema setosum]|uniref:uncharacterized protein n=1 Tax=Diadema setosum TaxID=31175 RepID=UPI003B3B635A